MSRVSPTVRSITPAARVKAIVPSGRACGECSACCTSLAIEELDKPMWRPCVALDAGNPAGSCSRYGDRPGSCRDFECLWLKGLILTDDEHRPDRCGLVLTAHPEQRTVEAVETSPGSADRPEASALIERLRAAQLNVVVTRPHGRERLTPLTSSIRPTVSVRRVTPAPSIGHASGPGGLRARAGGLG